MKDICRHCSDLSMLISMHSDWYNQAEWLYVASGITAVRFDVTRYDRGFGYCNEADRFVGAHEELLEKYVTELTRFTYVWGTIESLIDDLKPPPGPARGEINALCYYLKAKLSKEGIIHPYRELLQRLKSILMQSDVREPKIKKGFTYQSHVSEHGIGLYVIYKLRNEFAHGTIGFPKPNEENEPVSMYPELVLLATRIILLTMQMIWLAYYSGKNIVCSVPWECDEQFAGHEYAMEGILQNIHWIKPNYRCWQLPLF